jgi:hypothetical protein
MTRQHVVSVVTTDREAWPRAFPLVDLVRRGRQMDLRLRGEPPHDWVRRAQGPRTTSSVLALAATDDIVDPIESHSALPRDLGP